jgi:hypothetical protein
LLSADLILVCAKDFRDFFGLAPGLATDFALRMGDIRERKTISSAISQHLPDTRLILQDEIRPTYDSLFDRRSGITAVLLAGAALAFVILVWEKASGLSAEEKREIGILKAVGWETADVLLLRFWEGTVLALSSFLAGFILAYFHVFLGAGRPFRTGLEGLGRALPPVPADSVFRSLPGVNTLSTDRHSLRGGHSHALLGAGDQRSGYGDAGLIPLLVH